MRLKRHSAVIAEDLPDIYAFIAADDPVAAERILDAVELTFERLQQQPECGVPYKAVDAKLVECCWSSASRIILSSTAVEGAAVRILYVLHGARALPLAILTRNILP